MKTIAYAAAPEMQSMPVTLSLGSVQLTVSDGVMKEIECLCTGGLEGLAEAAPVTVSAKLTLEHNSAVEIPDAVTQQLLQGGIKENGQ